MRHGSLFSGIGGFDLAAEWMGWENVFHCEWNPFGQKVLKHYWPNSESFSDITKTDFKKYENTIDIITGGFPCQPYSLAGKRKGKEDDRHLWPQMLRCIQEIKPRWIVGENVYGLVNWDGGLVFHEVQTDLEAQGYEVQTYLLPACGVNAPHQRFRIFIVAYSEPGSDYRITGRISGKTKETNIDRQVSSTTSEQQIQLSSITDYLFRNSSDTNGIGRDNGSHNRKERQLPCNEEWNTEESKSERNRRVSRIRQISGNGDASHTDFTSTEYEIQARRNVPTSKDCSSDASDTGNTELQRSEFYRGIEEERKIQKEGRQFSGSIRSKWEDFPTVSPICDGDDGLSDRLDSITFSKWRNESIKAGGNAVVPQLVHQIFKAIEAYEDK